MFNAFRTHPDERSYPSVPIQVDPPTGSSPSLVVPSQDWRQWGEQFNNGPDAPGADLRAYCPDQDTIDAYRLAWNTTLATVHNIVAGEVLVPSPGTAQQVVDAALEIAEIPAILKYRPIERLFHPLSYGRSLSEHVDTMTQMCLLIDRAKLWCEKVTRAWHTPPFRVTTDCAFMYGLEHGGSCAMHLSFHNIAEDDIRSEFYGRALPTPNDIDPAV